MDTRNTNPQTLEHALRVLLNKVCVEWGFCIPAENTDRIACSEYLDGDQFAAAVLRAEGMNPEEELHWYRRIKRRFVHNLGSSVSARTYPENASN